MKRFMCVIATLHLTLIGVVIFHGMDDWVEGGLLEKPLAFLCSLNYSVWQYGFFSPDVGKSTEVEISLLEDDGKVVQYSTLEDFHFFTSNRESANRFYGFKTHTSSDTLFQDLCARSASVRMLNLHDQAWRISYVMRSIRYPTMAGYRLGEPPRIAELYRTEFELK